MKIDIILLMVYPCIGACIGACVGVCIARLTMHHIDTRRKNK